jgi:hypothetical protein
MISADNLLTLDQYLIVLRSVREPYNLRLDAVRKLRDCLNTIEAELRGLELKDIESLLKKDEKVEPFLTTIGSLTSQTENWVIHAQCVDKTDIKRWDLSRTSGQLFHVILEDKTGTIRATVFDSAVEKLYYFFEIGKEYAITNAKIRRKQDYSFEMSISDPSQVTVLKKQSQNSVTNTVSASVPVDNVSATTVPTATSSTPQTTKIRSILKVPSVSDEDDHDGLLSPSSVQPVRRNSSDNMLRSILKNSADDDMLRDDNLDQDLSYNYNRRYARNHEIEEAEEEDHGFRMIKKVGFKELDNSNQNRSQHNSGKKVGFKEIEDDEIPQQKSAKPSTSYNHSEETEDEDYHNNTSSPSTNNSSSTKKKVSIKDFESDSSTDRYSSPKMQRKKKSVSFSATSEDINDELSSPRNTPVIPTSDPKHEKMIVGEETHTGGEIPEKKTTFNIRKHFG